MAAKKKQVDTVVASVPADRRLAWETPQVPAKTVSGTILHMQDVPAAEAARQLVCWLQERKLCERVRSPAEPVTEDVVQGSGNVLVVGEAGADGSPRAISWELLTAAPAGSTRARQRKRYRSVHRRLDIAEVARTWDERRR